jgi:hypothetical protein
VDGGLDAFAARLSFAEATVGHRAGATIEIRSRAGDSRGDH